MENIIESCNRIISDADAVDMYNIDDVGKIHIINTQCKDGTKKEITIDLFDSSGGYMTAKPIHRVYHYKAPLRAFTGVGKVAEHKLFVLDEKYRNIGIATKVRAREDVVYRRNSFNEVQIDAAWDGVNVWRKMGYDMVNPDDKNIIFNAWRAYINDIWDGEEKTAIILKYKKIDEVPKKYFIPKGHISMGEWLLKSKALPLIRMYRRVV